MGEGGRTWAPMPRAPTAACCAGNASRSRSRYRSPQRRQAAPASSDRRAVAVDADFFENKVRPIFANSCYDCHDDTATGGLRLDSKAAFEKGGTTARKSFPAIPTRACLIQAVRADRRR